MTSPAPAYIDSHAHLDFYKPEEVAEIFGRMKDEQTAAISIGTNMADWARIDEIVKQNPDTMLGWTVGVHPSEVKENWREEVTTMEKFLFSKNTKILGIGECGLDFFKIEEKPNAKEIVEWQRATFAAQLNMIKQNNLPVVIHSRGAGAYPEIIKMIDAANVDWRRFVFHCFSEGPNEIRELNARGGRGSFTGIITFKNGQLMRDAMMAQGIETLMVETDSPFLSPEPHRGTQNDPSRVNLVAKKVAELFGVKIDDLGPKVIKTTREFFKL